MDFIGSHRICTVISWLIDLFIGMPHLVFALEKQNNADDPLLLYYSIHIPAKNYMNKVYNPNISNYDLAKYR